MGLLDGLKNKISESGYADKVSAGLNKIGEGLEAGSEKVHAFAESLQNKETANTLSPSNNDDPKTHEIQNRTSSTIIPQESNDITYQQENYSSNVSENYYRESFSVNENDSNGVRQFKETLQDVNTVLNNETMRNFSVAAREIATGIKEYKEREQLIEAELSRITLQNQHNLDVIKLTHEHYKPLLDEMIKQLKSSRKTLEEFDIQNLTDTERNQYNTLLSFISSHTSKVMSLYDKITG